MSTGRELLERRVPHYAAVYLGVSRAAVEFTSFAEQRHLISPHLTDLLLTTLVLLLPSVLLVAWCLGRRGSDRAPRAERVGVPLNVLVLVVVVSAAFGSKDPGAVSTRVAGVDEEVERWNVSCPGQRSGSGLPCSASTLRPATCRRILPPQLSRPRWRPPARRRPGIERGAAHVHGYGLLPARGLRHRSVEA
jgi:hypothetical protein